MLGLALLGAYANSFHGPFIFDDASSIVDNPSVRGFSTALFPPGNSGLTVSGRPMVNLSLAINYALGRENVVGYHVGNLVIHVLAAFFLFGVVRRILLLPSMARETGMNSFWIALAVAAIWGLHPLQTESVTYVIQRAESLVGLFYLATLYYFVRYVEQPSRLLWAWASVAACWLGMGSKEVMVSAPLVILLFDRTFVSGTFRAAWWARRGTYVALGATWSLLLLCVLSTGNRGSTAGFTTDVTVWLYALTQCYAITRYLGLVFWPSPLVLDYGGGVAAGIGEVWPYILALVALLAATILALRRWPKVGFLGVVFFAILAPSSSVVPVATQTIAEHRMYLPLAAVVAGLVVGLYRFGKGRSFVFVGIIAIALGVVTFNRNSDYQSVLTIWKDTVDHRPQNSRAFYSYGTALSEAKKYREAIDIFERALELSPTDRSVMIRYADVLQKLGETTKAIALLKTAIADRSPERVPDGYEAYNNLGAELDIIGEREEAMRCLRIAIKLKPDAEGAHINLAIALSSAGRFEAAAEEFRTALALKPADYKIYVRLGDTLLKLGKIEEAIAVLDDGVKNAEPTPELLSTLGAALLRGARNEDAKQRFEEALRINPHFGPAHVKLGLIFSASGDELGALTHYEAAIAAGEKDPVLFAVAGRALLAQGRTDEGLARLEKAVSLAPTDLQLKYSLAKSLLGCGRDADAAKLYEELIAQAPGPFQLHNELGLAYQRLGRLSEARAQFARALEIAPANEAVQKNLDGLNR